MGICSPPLRWGGGVQEPLRGWHCLALKVRGRSARMAFAQTSQSQANPCKTKQPAVSPTRCLSVNRTICVSFLGQLFISLWLLSAPLSAAHPPFCMSPPSRMPPLLIGAGGVPCRWALAGWLCSTGEIRGEADCSQDADGGPAHPPHRVSNKAFVRNWASFCNPPAFQPNLRVSVLDMGGWVRGPGAERQMPSGCPAGGLPLRDLD